MMTMRKRCVAALLVALATVSMPAGAANLSATDLNFLVLTHAIVVDQLHLAAFYHNPVGSVFSAGGLVTPTAWSGTVSAIVLGLPVDLSYAGTFDAAQNVASWTGVGSYGSERWTTSGTVRFTSDEVGIWQQSGYIEEGDGYSFTAGISLTSTDFVRWRLTPAVSLIESDRCGRTTASAELSAFYDIVNRPGGTSGELSGGSARLGLLCRDRFVSVTASYDGERDLPVVGSWLVIGSIASTISPEPASEGLLGAGIAGLIAGCIVRGRSRADSMQAGSRSLRRRRRSERLQPGAA